MERSGAKYQILRSKQDRITSKRGRSLRVSLVEGGKQETDGEVEYGMAKEEWECPRTKQMGCVSGGKYSTLPDQIVSRYGVE
jgi:hypothetical protein